MSVRMKKPPTKAKNLKILVDGEELKLPKEKERSLKLVIDSFIQEEERLSGEDVFGEDFTSPQMKVAKYLKGSRIKSNLSQLEVSKITKIRQPNLSAYENGRKSISKADAKKLSKLYNCNIHLLLST